jgi:uncharacterized membrane protein
MSYYNLIIVIAALGGFFISFYIFRKKRAAGEHLVCPIGSNCDDVVHSQYSVFLGMPVEILGLIYYAVVAICYTAFMFVPIAVPMYFVFGVFVVSLAAFLFSLYLTFIQLFNLRQICTWCLISASLCTVIFALAVSASSFGIVEILSEYGQAIRMFHILGVTLGVGGATITDIFFFKFLKDFRISESESDVLHTLSQIIWFALAVLIITGIGLYLPAKDYLNESPKFLVKMIVIGIIIINGALLNLLIAPKLVKISFGEQHEHQQGELHRERKLAFALGSISLVSWYSAFILGMMREIPYGFAQLLSVYLGILFLAVTASQIFDYYFMKRNLSS